MLQPVMPAVTSQRSFHPGVLWVKEASLFHFDRPLCTLHDSCMIMQWSPPAELIPNGPCFHHQCWLHIRAPVLLRLKSFWFELSETRSLCTALINSFLYQCCCTSCSNKSLSLPQPFLHTSTMTRCSYIHYMAAPWQTKQRCTALPHVLLGQGCPSTL